MNEDVLACILPSFQFDVAYGALVLEKPVVHQVLVALHVGNVGETFAANVAEAGKLSLVFLDVVLQQVLDGKALVTLLALVLLDI